MATEHPAPESGKQPPKIRLNGAAEPPKEEQATPPVAPPPRIRINMAGVKSGTARVELPPEVKPSPKPPEGKKSTSRIDASTVVPPPKAAATETAKKATARIDLGDAAARIGVPEARPPDELKKKTSRIDLPEAMKAAPVASMPRMVRIRRPGAEAPREEPIVPPPAELEGPRKSETARIELPPEAVEQMPTRRKTIRIKRPEGAMTSKPLVITRAPEGPARKAAQPVAVGVFYPLLTLAAVLVAIALVSVQSMALFGS